MRTQPNSDMEYEIIVPTIIGSQYHQSSSFRIYKNRFLKIIYFSTNIVKIPAFEEVKITHIDNWTADLQYGVPLIGIGFPSAAVIAVIKANGDVTLTSYANVTESGWYYGHIIISN